LDSFGLISSCSTGGVILPRFPAVIQAVEEHEIAFAVRILIDFCDISALFFAPHLGGIVQWACAIISQPRPFSCHTSSHQFFHSLCILPALKKFRKRGRGKRQACSAAKRWAYLLAILTPKGGIKYTLSARAMRMVDTM
jgi:hypothetical protein